MYLRDYLFGVYAGGNIEVRAESGADSRCGQIALLSSLVTSFVLGCPLASQRLDRLQVSSLLGTQHEAARCRTALGETRYDP